MSNWDSEFPEADSERPCEALKIAVSQSVERDRELFQAIHKASDRQDRALARIAGKLDVVLARDAEIFEKARRKSLLRVAAIVAAVSPIVNHALDLLLKAP